MSEATWRTTISTDKSDFCHFPCPKKRHNSGITHFSLIYNIVEKHLIGDNIGVIQEEEGGIIYGLCNY